MIDILQNTTHLRFAVPYVERSLAIAVPYAERSLVIRCAVRQTFVGHRFAVPYAERSLVIAVPYVERSLVIDGPNKITETIRTEYKQPKNST